MTSPLVPAQGPYRVVERLAPDGQGFREVVGPGIGWPGGDDTLAEGLNVAYAAGVASVAPAPDAVVLLRQMSEYFRDTVAPAAVHQHHAAFVQAADYLDCKADEFETCGVPAPAPVSGLVEALIEAADLVCSYNGGHLDCQASVPRPLALRIGYLDNALRPLLPLASPPPSAPSAAPTDERR